MNKAKLYVILFYMLSRKANKQLVCSPSKANEIFDLFHP